MDGSPQPSVQAPGAPRLAVWSRPIMLAGGVAASRVCPWARPQRGASRCYTVAPHCGPEQGAPLAGTDFVTKWRRLRWAGTQTQHYPGALPRPAVALGQPERAEVTNSCQGCPGPIALPEEVEVGGSGPVVGLGGHLCAIWVCACTCVRVHTHTCACVGVHARVCVCACVCMDISVCTHHSHFRQAAGC